MQGTLFIISAPSGAGKTSLIAKLLEQRKEYVFSISYTTRPVRGNEKNGIDYFFISNEKFEQMIANGEFLEYAKVHNYYYGTSKKFVIDHLNSNVNVILDIDFQGAEIVKNNLGNNDFHIVTIFIFPPSFEELKRRLEKRGTDKKEVIKKRLKNALIEMKHCNHYDYVLINDDFNETYGNLDSIFRSNELKKNKMEHKISEIVKDYEVKIRRV